MEHHLISKFQLEDSVAITLYQWRERRYAAAFAEDVELEGVCFTLFYFIGRLGIALLAGRGGIALAEPFIGR